jgi:hypothetical protein
MTYKPGRRTCAPALVIGVRRMTTEETEIRPCPGRQTSSNYRRPAYQSAEVANLSPDRSMVPCAPTIPKHPKLGRPRWLPTTEAGASISLRGAMMPAECNARPADQSRTDQTWSKITLRAECAVPPGQLSMTVPPADCTTSVGGCTCRVGMKATGVAGSGRRRVTGGESAGMVTAVHGRNARCRRVLIELLNLVAHKSTQREQDQGTRPLHPRDTPAYPPAAGCKRHHEPQQDSTASDDLSSVLQLSQLASRPDRSTACLITSHRCLGKPHRRATRADDHGQVRTGAVCGPSQRTKRCATTRHDTD